MKKTAKIISLILCLIMALSVVFTAAINASAANAPSFSVSSSLSGDKLTLSVSMTSGGFNALNVKFTSSGAANCTKLSLGKAFIDFRNELEDKGETAPIYSTNANTGLAGFASVQTYDKTGTFLVAEFEVDNSKKYSVNFAVDTCKVTEDGTDYAVTPKVANATYSHTPEAPTEPTQPTQPTQPETKKYTVAFNGNGATSGTMANQSFTYDVAQNLSANRFARKYTVKLNYNGGAGGLLTENAAATFKGWAKTAAGKVEYTDKQSVKNLAESGTVTLYAVWELGKITLPSPAKTGYTFDGWYKDNGFKNKVGSAGTQITPTADLSLYAKWTEAPTTPDSQNKVTNPQNPVQTTKIIIVTQSDGKTVKDASGNAVTSVVTAGTKTVVVLMPNGEEVKGADGNPFTAAVPDGYKAVAKVKTDGSVETDANGNPLFDIVPDTGANTDEAIVDAEDADADDADAFDYGAYTTTTTKEDTDNKPVSNSHLDTKVIIIVAAVAAVVIAGAVTAVVLVRKKSNAVNDLPEAEAGAEFEPESEEDTE